ncbi:MAG: branched-chain amino acid ABC transporter permease, partial [Rhodoferax sp.]|nr:branched-chain amino acid ABC transporter permease [Rhodoferax sp.]
AFLASVLIGVIQTFAVAFDYSLATLAGQLGLSLSEGLSNNTYINMTLSQIAPILPFLFLVLMLIFRPRGLLGTREG